ncbi:MAG: GNAT family N-acetyltransferase [Candidatus Scalindua sp.]|jgi:GNAT superfamily N-acetyltransferase|nr:GNAT family N-acetyltransferase [Candidatus Scalindua sp.]MBT5304865.1 GNAT family N-acetyltransferase [Candidatus Scalindua sp.]MBT6045283.1 GNAT family N-acetyltransferase [Candidatus Scalindua sp.]MBT6226465.1 GNAT family N-acetyltransferase [Candidatus Scalindua sp.]MBT6562814.1 GNAT family N-acetyltransferase [Candidatus Scalindua sp.]
MELIFEWKNILDQQAETAFVGFLSTLIGEAGANKLVEVAKIYEKHDWFKLLIAKENDNITGLLALYYEPIHGSHEGWICVNPEYRKQGIGDKIHAEFEKTALKNGIRIFRADATLAYTHSQKFLYRRDYKAVGYIPMSFSFLPGRSHGSAVTAWKIFDPELLKQWKEERRESLDWESRRWQCNE